MSNMLMMFSAGFLGSGLGTVWCLRRFSKDLFARLESDPDISKLQLVVHMVDRG